MMFDVDYTNPLGISGTLYAVIADGPEDAAAQAPYRLAANSHWRPDQFTVKTVHISIYSDTTGKDDELRQDQHA